MKTKDDFPSGTLVHIEGHGSNLFTVDSWFTDEEDGLEYCFADSEYSMGDSFPLEDLKLVMSAEKASERKIPTADEIVRSLDILGSSWDGGFDINETDTSGPGELCAYGETDEGLKFSFVVKVINVEGEF